MAINHENQAFPYSYRTLKIPLTDEQNRMLARARLGTDRGNAVHEELYTSHLEEEALTQSSPS